MDTLGAILGLLALVGLVWGMERLTSKWSREATERKESLAWMYLTWTDEDAEKHRQALLSQPNPGKYAIQLQALAMSRQMRMDLRGDLLSHRPTERT